MSLKPKIWLNISHLIMSYCRLTEIVKLKTIPQTRPAWNCQIIFLKLKPSKKCPHIFTENRGTIVNLNCLKSLKLSRKLRTPAGSWAWISLLKTRKQLKTKLKIGKEPWGLWNRVWPWLWLSENWKETKEKTFWYRKPRAA